MDYVENGNLRIYLESNKITYENNSKIINKFVYQLIDILRYLQKN